MKKISAILLALVMMLSMVAMAATITISDAATGETYTAYKIFDVKKVTSTSTNDAGETVTTVSGYAYTLDASSAWVDVLVGTTTNSEGETVAKQPYFTLTLSADGTVYTVEVVDTYANAGETIADWLLTNAPTGAEVVTLTSGTAANVADGYYLIHSTMGTNLVLATTDITIESKNEEPTVVKQVKEDSTNTWGTSNDADTKQTVEFKTTITAKKGAENYVLHDVLDNGLDLNTNSIVVAVGSTTLTAGTDYTLKTSALTDGCDFEIVFAQSYLDTILADTEIVVTYSAVLDTDAVIALPGNDNDTKLTYGTASTTTTSSTTTYTYELDILKHVTGNETAVLSGAKFVILNSAKTHVASIQNGIMTGWVEIVDDVEADEENNIAAVEGTDLNDYALTTGADGKIAVDGLDVDTYYLRELEAPVGYNKLAEDVVVNVIGKVASTTTNSDGSTSYTYTTLETKVGNSTGTELPSTGGMGTTIFYVVGGLMMAAAVVLLVSKKKVNA